MLELRLVEIWRQGLRNEDIRYDKLTQRDSGLTAAKYLSCRFHSK